MNSAALIVALCLAQAEGDAPAAPVAAPVAAPAAKPAAAPEAEAAGEPAPGEEPTSEGPPRMMTAPSIYRQVPHLDEVKRIITRLPTLSPEEQVQAYQEIRKLVGNPSSSPILPPLDFDLLAYNNLSDPDQVKVTARRFFEDVVAGNAGAAVAHAGFPFVLENRRFDRPDELRTEIARHLRSKRTDLLQLYDVEVLTPQEMEKKYGKAPARLAGWQLRQQQTYLAVGNLSGRAVVLMFRKVGLAWQAVGWHD